MTTPLAALRLVAVLGVVAALLDPGCPRPRRPILDVRFVGDLAEDERQRELQRLAEAAPWAEVSDERRAAPVPARAGVAAVVAGDAAPVLEALRARPAMLAWQVASPALTVTAVRAPARIVAGTRTDLRVTLGGVPTGPGQVRVEVGDAGTGLVQARVDVPIPDAAPRSATLVSIPWLATRPGQQTLRVRATYEGRTLVRPAPPGDVVVDVRPADVVVEVLEARPTWATRFARLALTDVAGIRLRSEVRVAPGLAVRTTPMDSPARDEDADAAVLMVGGLEALTSADVTRLERAVRDRGRAVVLLMDEMPGGGPWRRLWPGGVGAVRTASTPVTGRVAGHVWRTREWVSAPVSTGVVPLAYLDSNTPIVLGRALGAGRVVLVTALDAWRWRAEPEGAFAAGWRALVQRLGVDVPPPVAATAWVAGTGRDRRLQVEAVVRPDLIAAPSAVIDAEVGPPGRPVALWEVETGRWRGAVRVQDTAAATVQVALRSGGQVVAQDRVVVDVSAPRLVGSWEDVARHQARHGALTTDGRDSTLARLRAALESSASDRWYVTRTWWWAGLLVTGLGVEWLLRRLRGAR